MHRDFFSNNSDILRDVRAFQGKNFTRLNIFQMVFGDLFFCLKSPESLKLLCKLTKFATYSGGMYI